MGTTQPIKNRNELRLFQEYYHHIMPSARNYALVMLGLHTAYGTRRYAKAGGSFSYTMLVNPEGTALLVTLRNQDLGKTLRICVEDVVVFETGLDESIVSKESLREEGYFDLLIPLEKQILSMAQMVTVDGQNKPALRFTFSAALDPNGETKESASVCQFLYTVENN